MKIESQDCPQCGQDLRLPPNVAGLMADVQKACDALYALATRLDTQGYGFMSRTLEEIADSLEVHLK